MKTDKKDAKFTLAAYTAFATCFLSLQEQIQAQVVYVDIDPNSVLDEKYDMYSLDMDMNGTTDFAFQNSSFTFFNVSFSSYRLLQDLLAGPYIPTNAIAGVYNFISGYYYDIAASYPFALNKDNIISNALTWQTEGIQLLALKSFVSYAGPNTWICGNCYWYYSHGTDIINHYLGVRFIDEIGQNHYGWIRCDVKDSGRTLVIKDYAYEMQADYPILAGDTTHYVVGINQLENTLKAAAYSYGKSIYINTNTLQHTALIIYDITGNEILKQDLDKNTTIIDMQKYAVGIYVVALKQGDKIFTKKVVVGR